LRTRWNHKNSQRLFFRRAWGEDARGGETFGSFSFSHIQSEAAIDFQSGAWSRNLAISEKIVWQYA
jgi:hypothetical protein